jgi:hypothetical protein
VERRRFSLRAALILLCLFVSVLHAYSYKSHGEAVCRIEQVRDSQSEASERPVFPTPLVPPSVRRCRWWRCLQPGREPAGRPRLASTCLSLSGGRQIRNKQRTTTASTAAATVFHVFRPNFGMVGGRLVHHNFRNTPG